MLCIKTLGYSVLIGSVICSAASWYSYKEGCKDEQVRQIAKQHEVNFNQLTQYSKNKEVVYIPMIESTVELVTQIKEVKIYVKEKTDWSDTRCIPVARLRGYRDSLYPNNANSASTAIESLSSANNSTDTSK